MARNHDRERVAMLLRHLNEFFFYGEHISLRPYQEEAVLAVINNVRQHTGLTFVWIFPRQSGKDEALAVMVSYLLTHTQLEGGEMVFINPTFKPQTETSMRRLEARLNSNILSRGKWSRKSGYIYKIGSSYCTYMSADGTSHIVGATANRLLLINEAQDISPFKFDKDIDSMVASTNAAKLFSGTRWTSDTLLERELVAATQAEKKDGIRRVFFFTSEDVRKYVPSYGKHVDGVIARLGRQNPLVKTQYFCETIDAQTGMFPPGRQALMHGSHPSLLSPVPGHIYAFLIDVAGQDECAGRLLADTAPADDVYPRSGHTSHRRSTLGLQNPGRDSTALKIVEIDSCTLPVLGKPTYQVIFRHAWTGEKHVTVFGALRALGLAWKPMRIVIDATGVGKGLWSSLDNAFGSDMLLRESFSPPCSMHDPGFTGRWVLFAQHYHLSP